MNREVLMVFIVVVGLESEKVNPQQAQGNGWMRDGQRQHARCCLPAGWRWEMCVRGRRAVARARHLQGDLAACDWLEGARN